VRLLEARYLTDVGKRPMDAGDPGYGLWNDVTRTGVDASLAHMLEFERALRSKGIEPTDWGHDRAVPPSHAVPSGGRRSPESRGGRLGRVNTVAALQRPRRSG
jgi:hypothetical protein